MTRRRKTFVANTGSFKLKRLGQIMEPEPGNPMEVEGVLNPAAGAVLITTSTIVVAINASLLKVKE